MRKIAFYAILFAFFAILTGCTGKDVIASRAEHFVRSTYNDVDRVLSVKVDTVTYGENLDYRMEQARHRMEFSAMMNRDYGGKAQEESLARDKAWVAALDSLKGVSGDILGDPAAYNCIVVYNDTGTNPGHIVWVQLDKYGNLLNITKEPEKVLLNPGEDVPGYFDAWKKHHSK